ncbi:MAG TPA: dienelactone hydrolase family protein [Candidatus Dormibacteraeota bacterium]|nr:dienelactone hydrolase family protein [Candidatus Dormibacteraeota bacterium]
MCYGIDAQPPSHAFNGEVASEQDLVLKSSDGTEFSARLARPAKPNGRGIVILPDVRGLYSYYCVLARRFAEAGVEAIAIDYFGRTAGLTDGRTEDFDFMAHLSQGKFDDVSTDTSAGVAHLRGLGTVQEVFTVGFCFGGAMSWRQSADQQGLAGAIGFYGVPGRVRDRIPGMKAPLLLLLAGDDRATSPEASANFQQELTAAGVEHLAHTYDGAPHSFFDRGYDEWKDACSDSWKRIFGFMGITAAAV